MKSEKKTQHPDMATVCARAKKFFPAVLSLKQQGKTIRQICQTMEEHGYESPFGKQKWSPCDIFVIWHDLEPQSN